MCRTSESSTNQNTTPIHNTITSMSNHHPATQVPRDNNNNNNDEEEEEEETPNERRSRSTTTTTSSRREPPSLSLSHPLTWPEDLTQELSYLQQWYQNWTYSYMRPILRKGAQQTSSSSSLSSSGNCCLTQEDLFRVPQTMQSQYVSQQFEKYYQEYRWEDDNNMNINNKKKKHPRTRTMQLIRTLWSLAKPTFVPAGFCQLITVLCQVALPLLVREILQLLEEDNTNDNSITTINGMLYTGGIFMTAVLHALGNHRHKALAIQSGIVMRAATINILYARVLQLTSRGKQGLSSGEITNLIATDTQKLFEVTQEGHLIWSLPLSIVLVTLCLVLVMGPTTLVGVAVLILFVPLVERLTAQLLSIRNERVKMTDARVGIVSAMLQGIKVTKLNCYEEKYLKRVIVSRDKELHFLQRELAVWAMSLVLTVISPVLATSATFAVYVLIDEGNSLTAARSFSVLLFFSALRFPINFAGRLLGKATQAYSAVKRISKFLERETWLETECDHDVKGTDTPLALENATFFIDAGHRLAFHSSHTITVRTGEVLAVCGPVGSGKSSLINGIIRELPASAETIVRVDGRLAFVGQSAFILNATLRDNILFNRPYDAELYEIVLDVCCLRADIELLTSKDLTMIGERGVTLSGGQKQRVSIARAAYSSPDVVLLDDPLSALDSGTAKLVFERLIKGPNAFFNKTAVVLVTHASYFLNRVDNIMVVVDGESKFLGSWAELAGFEAHDSKTINAIEFIRSSVQEDAQNKEEDPSGDAVKAKTLDEAHGTADVLMTTEEREHGLSSMSTWMLWFKHAGGVWFLSFQIIFMAIDRIAYVAVEYWIARWTSATETGIDVFGFSFPPQTDGRSAQFQYLKVYSSILIVSVLATIVRSEFAVTGGRRAARNLFSRMLTRIIYAPLCTYFEATPLGRILNRFTYDMEVIDVTLTQTMSMFLISCSWYVAGVCVMVSILPWILLAIVPVTIAYWFLMLYYRKTGNDLQRLDAVSRSPVQAMISEAVDGAASIRVFSQAASFTKKIYCAIDQNSAALLCFVTAQRWLAFRIELLGSLVVLLSCLLVITMRDTLGIDAGLVGLLILWSSNFTITLGFMVDAFSEAEAAITATERVDSMSRVPQEKSMFTADKNRPHDEWPKSGNLEFHKVALRYRDSLPLALDDLSFTIPAGKKVGICGRTGAGKSSLAVALFRLVEIESGNIFLDGVDLATLGLSDVRGRNEGMSIIPQDPFLVGSTLRECVDPFSQASDAAILSALQSVHLAKGDSSVEVLDTAVAEGGLNYSVGERQLLNLARVLLSKPKLLLLDEATSSIDGETDALIQVMLRTKFIDTTLITVAHRLETIIDFDLLIVMDAGRAIEIGTPRELLEKSGVFSDLVDATGPEGSKALRSMVP